MLNPRSACSVTRQLLRRSPILVLLLTVAAAVASAQESGGPRIVNGLPTTEFPQVVALLDGPDPATAGVFCSGTLIGCETVLTAAHCVCPTVGANCQNLDPSSTFVYFQNAAPVAVEAIVVQPGYSFPVADVALLKLGSLVDGIAPSRINLGPPVLPGTAGTIVGFGKTEGFFNADYGLKRQGEVVTASCEGGISNFSSICWDFREPIGPLGEDSNTCNGDSGGPLFVDPGTGPVLAGVTSGGNNFTCDANDHSFDARVGLYAEWIQSNGGNDVYRSRCSAIALVGGPDAQVTMASGSLGSTNPIESFQVAVAADTEKLVVNVNGIDDGLADFDMLMKLGGPPSPVDFDCAQTDAGQFASCSIDAPDPGIWHVAVVRVTGEGAYQAVATAYVPNSAGNMIALNVSTLNGAVPPGDRLPFLIEMTNLEPEPLATRLRFDVQTPSGNVVRVAGPIHVDFAAKQTIAPQVSMPIPATAPIGSYALIVTVVDDQGVVLKTDQVSFMIVSAEAP